MAAERYLVLPSASASSSLESFEAAERLAGPQVDKDRTARVIVKIVGEVKPRALPNVDVVRFDAEQADG
jgi:hypothetical protein